MPSNNRSNKKSTDKTRPYKTTRKTSERSNVDGVTKRVPTVKNTNNSNKKQQKRKNKFSDRHPKLMITIKILIILFLLCCVIGAGIIAAMFFGLFGDDFQITKEELVIGTSNSVVLDKNGNEIANLSKEQQRKIITLDQMADYLPKAYVAIEDKRFYDHNGVDWKRTAGAIFNTIFTGGSSYGGSTITQQLVKNITDERESEGIAGILRKVREWAKAYQVERMISKQQILELYLNILFVGGRDIHGVELGAQYYFSKSAKDLDLAECAFLAGINSSPNSYNPFDTTDTPEEQEAKKEKIKNKVLTVLSEMKDQGFITNEEDYNAAVAKAEAGLTFTQGDVESGSDYSYHTDAALKQIIDQVMEEKGVTREFAEKYVYSSGLTIYSTQDSGIQSRVEEEFSKAFYQFKGNDKNADGTLKNEHAQAGMAIVDHKTGQVVAVGGNLGEQKASGWNRATQMVRQTGSSIKPIADVAPGLQEKVITVATVYNDVKTDFNGYSPKNDNNVYRGAINIRQFIATSQNIPAVKIMKELTPKKSMEYMKKMGISTLDENGDNNLPLAIGGLTTGISPLEMAAAYGTIANDGVYITPTFYTKVTDSSGNVVLTPKQEQNRAISEQVAYITRSIVEEPVKSGGTATYCAIPGMQTCAKTGTTDGSKDRWLCGMTPYYSAAVWFGYDTAEEVRYNGRNPAGQIWSNVMKDIHKNLANANFNTPSGITQATVCRKTGLLATSNCTDTYTEMFTQDNIPEKCEGHGVQKICTESGKLATKYCPETKNNSYGGTIPKESLKLWNPSSATSSVGKITETCTIHTKETQKPKDDEKQEDDNSKENKTDKKENKTEKDNTTNTSDGKTNSSKNNTTEKPKENTTNTDSKEDKTNNNKKDED